MYANLCNDISRRMDIYILFAKSCKFLTEPEYAYNSIR